MKALIEKFKNQRKRSFILSGSKGKYAFVGLGMHSLNNLYPIINYFRGEIKYIVTRSEANAQLIDENFPHSIGTNDLDSVLKDPDITGVFISANPAAHFGLVKKVLKADKHVFVEKPPCFTSNELEELIQAEKQSKGNCWVGLQKQYAPCNQELKKNLGDKSCSYNYRFLTGGYPEGDPFLDLFIHPVSLLTYLFGDVVKKQVLVHKTKSAITVFLQAEHANGSKGSVELSTDYSWQNPLEKLGVNTPKGVYETTNTEQLNFSPKAGTLMGIPKEKLLKKHHQINHLVDRNNFGPILQNNQLYALGYYNEIKSFMDFCEQGKGENHATLESCRKVYELLDNLKKEQHV